MKAISGLGSDWIDRQKSFGSAAVKIRMFLKGNMEKLLGSKAKLPVAGVVVI